MNDSVPLALLDESQIKDLIYEVRGQKVMLDFDLARIYGYGTSAFNQQIKRNLDRFPQDFSFQLTKREFESILLSHFVTSSWDGRRSLPRDIYAHDRFAWRSCNGPEHNANSPF